MQVPPPSDAGVHAQRHPRLSLFEGARVVSPGHRARTSLFRGGQSQGGEMACRTGGTRLVTVCAVKEIGWMGTRPRGSVGGEATARVVRRGTRGVWSCAGAPGPEVREVVRFVRGRRQRVGALGDTVYGCPSLDVASRASYAGRSGRGPGLGSGHALAEMFWGGRAPPLATEMTDGCGGLARASVGGRAVGLRRWGPSYLDWLRR